MMETSQWLQGRHKGVNHLVISQGGKFSYVLVPQLSFSPENELQLCFTDHDKRECDPPGEQCCLRESGHVHAHVHNGDLIEHILLEECMDGSGCSLPLLWDTCFAVFSEGDDHDPKGDHHVHSADCGHEQISHGDHTDYLVPLSDGSFLISHGHLGDNKISEHGRLVKIGESQGRSKNYSKSFFDLFRYEGPQHEGFATAIVKSLCTHDPPLCSMYCTRERQPEVCESTQPLLHDEPGSIVLDIDAAREQGHVQKTTIDVLGICCPAEVPLIKKLLEPVPGVQEVTVNVAMKTVTVHHNPVASPPALLVKVLNSAKLDASIHVSGEWKTGHKLPSPYTIASGFLLCIAFFHYLYPPLKWVALGSVAVGLPPILLKSFLSLRSCILDINMLMLIAVGGAIALTDYLEAGTIVFLFTLADWLESRSTEKARQAISSVASLAPQNAELADTGMIVPVSEVKVGTRLSVKPGELVPIDGIVVSGRSSIDESSLTGESFPVEKEVGSRVWAGTISLSGYICVETNALAEDSAVAKMIKLVEDAQTQRSRMDQLIEKFAKYYTPIIVVASLLVALIPLSMHAQNLHHWFYLALVLLVVACPCALVISTPVTTTCAVAQAARTGLIVKGGRYLEVLGKVKVLAVDKTGTLTEGCFEIAEMRHLSGPSDMGSLLHWISSIESKSSHPLASAIVEYAKMHGATADGNVDDFTVLPGEGVSGRINGHEVLIGNERLANRLNWMEGEKEIIDSWKSQGLMTSWVVVDGKFELIFSAGDQLRTEAIEAVNDLRGLGLRISMLTGDSQATAAAVQRKIGDINVHAQLLPEHKVDVLKQLKATGCTGMVGDGINDAPALAAADVGIAMGVAGSAIAMETADIALMTNDLRKVAVAVKLARKASSKILQNILLSVTTKGLVIALAIAGYSSLWGAVVVDVGTCLLVIANSMLLLERRKGGSCMPFKFGHRHHGKVCHRSSKCSKSKTCCKSSGNCNDHHHEETEPKNCCDKNSNCTGIRRRVSLRDVSDKEEMSKCCQKEVANGCCSDRNEHRCVTSAAGILREEQNIHGKSKCCDVEKKESPKCCQMEMSIKPSCCNDKNGNRCSAAAYSPRIETKNRCCEVEKNSKYCQNGTSCGSEGKERDDTCNEAHDHLSLDIKSVEKGCCGKREENSSQFLSDSTNRSTTKGSCCKQLIADNQTKCCQKAFPTGTSCNDVKDNCCNQSNVQSKNLCASSSRSGTSCNESHCAETYDHHNVDHIRPNFKCCGDDDHAYSGEKSNVEARGCQNTGCCKSNHKGGFLPNSLK